MESFDMNSANQVVLKTDHLSISFGGLKAVDDVNLEITRGDLYGLIGPNGAGKTTVFNILPVFINRPPADSLCGRDLTGKSPSRSAVRASHHLPEYTALFENDGA